jgi:carbamoyl-phosphate synthase large subunit
LDKYGVQVLGTPIETIRETEDCKLFADRLRQIDVKVANSRACQSVEEAREAARSIGFPVMLRGAFALGGKGSGIVETEERLAEALRRAFSDGVEQVLVEECLRGWKEIEYEMVRDGWDNCIAVCNMENLDPMGIHTGESIVVAPSQTLNDQEYQDLRSIAIKVVRELGIVGECNIQYALSPHGFDYRVIEVNARLSRSSALASKATGYPLAFVAAKIALGKTLTQIPNGITRRTTAFFEPAMDYIVCKCPRWDLTKFRDAAEQLGSEMKSVGEVMAIGRTFPEVIQKSLRMLDIGVKGLDPDAFEFDDIQTELAAATPRRIFALAKAIRDGLPIEDIHHQTRVDRWFLQQIEPIVKMHKHLQENPGKLDAQTLRKAKKLGFSDLMIEGLQGRERGSVRELRRELGLLPNIAQIDTMAAEFPADTNYLYTTYHASQTDIAPTQRKKIMVLGSGTYRIGSSVEFDWCCVNAVQTAAELGFETIMVNYNPETVSTDYDVCDRLIFDEISLETILDLNELEKPDGIIVSMGGQIPNNLAKRLHDAGVKIFGTSPVNIDMAEDRKKFSGLLDQLEIDQPKWMHVTEESDADSIVEKLGGFPVLVRPSYVLSGAAMSVAHESNELQQIMGRAKLISPDFPVVVSKFETHAREIEIDAVAEDGKLVLWALSEHIEDAGVHSGDATLVFPPQKLYISTFRRIKQIAAQLAENLRITGPFNVQFLAKQNAVKVIECNLRASRSFPFVSKVMGQNFAAEATRRMLGVAKPVNNNCLDLDYVAVKVPMFSFARLVGVDPMLGVEMASTGEVGCFGRDIHEALLHGLLATGFKFPRAGVLLSLGPVVDKYSFAEEAEIIAKELDLPIYATQGTAGMLRELGIDCVEVGKRPNDEQNAMDLMDDGKIDLVINVSREFDESGRPDGFFIRRRATESGVSLVTDLQLARALVAALRCYQPESLSVADWGHYVSHL